MSLTTILGLIIGFAGFILGFLLEGGHISMLLKETAALIVFGGTIGAVVISFSAEELKTVPYFLKRFLRRRRQFENGGIGGQHR